MGYQWTKEEENIIRDSLNEKRTFEDIQKLLPHRTMASIIARKEHLKIYLHTPFIKDESFFEKINPASAWVAGWLATDGCISVRSDNSSKVSIQLQHRDIQIIHKIKELVKSNASIYYAKRTNEKYLKTTESSGIAFFNANKWVKDLKEIWNIIPRKTLLLEPPKIYDKDSIYAYIQGAIEGDGTINLSRSNKSIGYTLRISIVGTEPLLNWIKKHIDILDINNNNSKVNKLKGENIFLYSFYNENAIAFWNKIKDLDTFKLDRKWDKVKFFNELLEYYRNTKFNSIKEKFDLINQKYDLFYKEYCEKYKKEEIVSNKQKKFHDFSINENISKEDFKALLINYLEKYAFIFLKKSGKKPYLCIEINGIYSFLNWLQEKINNFFGISNKRITLNNLNSKITYVSNESKLLFNELNLKNLSKKHSNQKIIDFMSEKPI